MPDLTPDVERELAALDDALAGRRVAPDLTELGELALALREERPRPADDFGRFLDTRVERGFPGRDPRVRVSGRRWWQTLLTVARARHGDGGAARRRDRRRGPRRAATTAAAAARRRRARARRRAPAPAAGARRPPTRRAARSSGRAATRPPARRTPTRRPSFAEPLPPTTVPPAPGPRLARLRRPRAPQRRALRLADARRAPARHRRRQRADPGRDAPAGRLRRLLDGQLVGGRRRRHVRAAHPDAQPRRRDGRPLAARQGARARAALAGHHGRGRLRPQPPEGRAHRAQEPAAPARRRGDA